jgi:glycosyltransferase involved in cell wall biosynthesis
MNILNVSTYPPRLCGIASFSKDLRDSLVSAGHHVWIAAISDDDGYTYPPEVYCEIRQDCKDDYIKTARLINNSQQIQVVIIQHEYGIFGGTDGEYLLDFVSVLEKPYLLVTHTVLPQPEPNQNLVLRLLTQQAAAVVCMTERSARLLQTVYEVPGDKISIIPHGVPVFQVKDRQELKKEYGCADRKVITTFGFIGPSKGLEIGITATKMLVDKHPDLLYIIAGRTHPVLQKQEKESYREMLLGMVADFGLDDHIRFVNKYLDVEELGNYLYMTDIYLSPYPNRDQAVSGTLAYAVGCGRAIVSTPYEYALDLIQKKKCGLVAPEVSPEALSRVLDMVLSRPELQRKLEKYSARVGATLKWPYVAARYVDLARAVRRNRVLEVKTGKQVLNGGIAAIPAERKGIWR